MSVPFTFKPSWRSVALLLCGMLVLVLSEFFRESRLYEVLLLLGFAFAGFLLHRLWRQSEALSSAVSQAQASEQHNALLAAALESATFGVAITAPAQTDNPIIFINKAFSTITGYAAEDALGRGCGFLNGIHTRKDDSAAMAAAFEGKSPLRLTVQHYRKDQTPFWNDLQIKPLFDADNNLKNFIVILDDVSVMHRTQHALTLAKEQAERATTVKSNFLAMMSHEIRTPINGILGTLTLINDMELTSEARQLAETAHHSADALLCIVNDMLDFSKIEAGKLSLEAIAFDLRDLVNDCIALMQPMAERKKIRLELQFDDSLPDHAAGDPTRIKQVLLNLVSNAIKFTERGGVTVKISNLMAHAGESGSESIVRFEIMDTGIGMSQEGMTRIFTEFNQLDPSIARRYGGTGLGLAICKRLVQMMNGEINVESRLGEGSKFSFVLPLPVVSSRGDSIQAPLDDGTRQSAASILVVEDNDTNQLVIGKMLERAGHRHDVAENGEIAIAMVQAKPYDLVFMDVSMPVMDGLAATRHIRALGGAFSDLPIIAMTAQSMQGDRERCLAAGMNDYLSKPLRRELLLRMLQHWLKSGAVPQPEQPVMADASPALLSGDAAIDWDVLRQMEDDVGQDTVKRLLNVFEQDMRQRVVHFHDALATKDWDSLQREAHTLKSSSASCGLVAFSAAMQSIEAALANGDKDSALDQAAHVDSLARAAQDALVQARHHYQQETRP